MRGAESLQHLINRAHSYFFLAWLLCGQAFYFDRSRHLNDCPFLKCFGVLNDIPSSLLSSIACHAALVLHTILAMLCDLFLLA